MYIYIINKCIIHQVRAAQGHKYTTHEGSEMESELSELRAERSVVTLQVTGRIFKEIVMAT